MSEQNQILKDQFDAIKKMLEEKAANEASRPSTGYCVPVPRGGCPSCGYCQHCGRGGQYNPHYYNQCIPRWSNYQTLGNLTNDPSTTNV